MIKKIWLIIFIITGAVLFAENEAGKPAGNTGETGNTATEQVMQLDIGKAVMLAEENNLLFANSVIDLQNSKLDLSNAWNQFIPGPGLSASLGTGGSEQATERQTSLGLVFRASLNVSAAMIYNARQAVLDYRNGTLTLEQARKSLAYNVKKSYYNLILLVDQMELLKKQIDKARSAFETILLKYELNIVPEIDKLKSEYACKSLIPDYDKMQNDYSAALLEFKHLLGLNGDVGVQLTDTIPDIRAIDDKQVSGLSVQNNPDIQVLAGNIRSSENQVDLARASYYPSLSLSYSYSSSFAGDPFTDNCFDGANWNGSWSAGIGVSIPIDSYLPYSSVQTAIAQKKNNVIKNKNILQDTIDKKQMSAENITATLKQVEESYDVLKINSEISDRAYVLARQLFDTGAGSYQDVRQAENDVMDANLKLLNARYQYTMSYLDLLNLFNIDEL
ncbi:MAG: TolC family protein [Spirochaetales bacterium]|nr:TolC family protein [Spirochaetales bacterium]